MSHHYLLILSCLVCFFKLSAQENSMWITEGKSTELSLNITNTLAGFFNSGGSGLSTDPYLIGIKAVKNKDALRLGVGFKHRSKEENDEFLGTVLNTDETNVQFRIGGEKRIDLGKRFLLFYGGDIAFRYVQSDAILTSFPSDIVVKSWEAGLGAGPVLGAMFHLTPRISLSTEAFLYGIAYEGEKKEPKDNVFEPVTTRFTGFDLVPALPSSLYIVVKF